MCRIILILCLALFMSVYSSFGDESIEGYLSQGDISYDQRNLKAALEAYDALLKLEPKNYEAIWKLSRTYSDLGEQDRKNQESYYQKSLDLARQAVELYPEGSKGHLYLSIALGKLARSKGSPKERIRLSKEIKAEAQRAVELDSKESLAWHILGCWNRELATLNWIERKFADVFLGGVPKEASVDKAVECFKKAIEINPQIILHHMELAITYESLDHKDIAIAEYQEVLELPIHNVEDEAYQEKARERLRKLEP